MWASYTNWDVLGYSTSPSTYRSFVTAGNVMRIYRPTQKTLDGDATELISGKLLSTNNRDQTVFQVTARLPSLVSWNLSRLSSRLFNLSCMVQHYSDVLVFCLPLERSIALQGLPFRNSHGHQGRFPTFICFYSFIREFSGHCFRDRISWFSNQDLDTGKEILGTRRKSVSVWEQASEEGGSWEKTWMQWRNLKEKKLAA